MENQRIRLTKQMLKTALIELMKIKPIYQISITELCKKAQINRVTFYKYYSIPMDILSEMETEIIMTLEEKISNYKNDSSHLISTLEFIQQRKVEILVLIQNNPSDEWEQKLFYSTSIQNILKKQIKNQNPEKAYLFICYGAYSIIKKWLVENCSEPIEDVANFIHDFIKKLL